MLLVVPSKCWNLQYFDEREWLSKCHRVVLVVSLVLVVSTVKKNEPPPS